MGSYGNHGLKAALAAMAVIVSAPAVAQPVAAGFAPPVGRDIGYHTVERRNQSDRTLAFTLEQRVRFARDGDDFLMTTTLLSANSDAPPNMSARFSAAFRPFVGLSTTLRLSARGKPLGLVDEAGTWARLLAAIAALRADSTLEPGVAELIGAVFKDMGALPPEQRSAILSESPLRLIGFALPPMEPGARIEAGDGAAKVTASLAAIRDGSLIYTLLSRKPAADNLSLVSMTEFEVDRVSGLLRRSNSREWLGDAAREAGKPADVEIQVELIAD